MQGGTELKARDSQPAATASFLGGPHKEDRFGENGYGMKVKTRHIGPQQLRFKFLWATVLKRLKIPEVRKALGTGGFILFYYKVVLKKDCS